MSKEISEVDNRYDGGVSIRKDPGDLPDDPIHPDDEPSIRFPECPNCGLPTHTIKGEERAYCASCNEYFDMKKSKNKLPELNKREGPSYRNAIMVSATLFIVAVLIVGSISYLLLRGDDNDSIIDIDDVSEIRELEPLHDVPRKSISQKEYSEYIQDNLDPETRRDLWETETILKCLFAADENFDLVEIAENSTGTGVAGFYDPDSEELYVVGHYHSSNYINYILSHELTHAIQDQHFDLDGYMQDLSYDLELARLSAVEGDAMITMEMWAEENLDSLDKLLISVESLSQIASGIDTSTLQEGNAVLGTINYLPYTAGMEFVDRIYQEDRWEGVNDLYNEKPPLSTEHILHYDKYVEYEKPVDVTYDREFENMELEFQTTLGEALLSEILAYNLDGYVSYGSTGSTAYYGNNGPANGWGGDLFSYYEGDDSYLSVLVTAWDTEEDNEYHQDILEQNFYELGNYWEEKGVYRIDDKYVYFEGMGDSTTLYCSDSLDVIEDLK